MSSLRDLESYPWSNGEWYTQVEPYRCDVCERVWERRTELPQDLPPIEFRVPAGGEMVLPVFEARCPACVVMTGALCDCGHCDWCVLGDDESPR